jgi:hypothetical protein
MCLGFRRIKSGLVVGVVRTSAQSTTSRLPLSRSIPSQANSGSRDTVSWPRNWQSGRSSRSSNLTRHNDGQTAHGRAPKGHNERAYSPAPRPVQQGSRRSVSIAPHLAGRGIDCPRRGAQCRATAIVTRMGGDDRMRLRSQATSATRA